LRSFEPLLDPEWTEALTISCRKKALSGKCSGRMRPAASGTSIGATFSQKI